MKKIGFIDYYLDEWHSCNYPAWFKEQSGGEYELKYAYGQVDAPNGLTNAAWCEKYGAELCDSIDEVVEKSDCLVVLAPDDTAKHLELALPAVSSGKPVFIDKTFCNSRAEAEQIFAAADKSGSPCFSSSAFRFSQKLWAVERRDISSVICCGHLEPDTYLVHQLEPLAILMGTDVKKVMYAGNDKSPSWQLCFTDGRTASVNMLPGEYRHYFTVSHADSCETVVLDDDIWVGATNAMLELFRTGKEPVERAESIGIMAIREKCLEAMKKPCEWIDL